MKSLLLDQGLPRSTVSFLAEFGFTALHAAEIGLSRAPDSEILEYARQRELIVVTLDADFHMLLAISGATSPSVIRLRRQRLNAKEAAAVIRAVLECSQQSLEEGAVVSVSSTLIRVKRLPLPRPRNRSSHP